jgi:hypothetical protein
MSGALAYAKAPYTIGRAMLTGASDTIRAARADPTNAKKALELSLMTAGIGGAASRAFGGLKGLGGGPVLGANVFQGGPHKYGPEGAAKSLDHINTGEGAQAYGWGRYDAGSPEVAKQYQMRVPAQDTKRTFLHALPEDAGIEDVVDLLGKGHFSESQETLIRALQADDWLGFDYPSQAISAAYSKNLDNWNPSAALRSAVDDSGRLYKHDLPDEDIARYLDWDAPLNEQPGSVNAGLRRLPERYRRDLVIDKSFATPEWAAYERAIRAAAKTDSDADKALQIAREMVEGNRPRTGDYSWQHWKSLDKYAPDVDHNAIHDVADMSVLTGGDFVQTLGAQIGGQQVSALLREAGIPGLKYYDQMSRPGQKGTRNYLTWDQDVLDRMKLLERDGETFAMGGSPLAAAPLALEQQRPALTPEMLQALLADPNGA